MIARTKHGSVYVFNFNCELYPSSVLGKDVLAGSNIWNIYKRKLNIFNL